MNLSFLSLVPHEIFPQALEELLKHVAPQDIAGEFARPDDLHQPRYFELFHVVGERRRVDAHAIAHRAAGERVRAFAETLQDLVAAPLAQGLRDQKNLILRQRFASRFRLPHTFEYDRFKLKESCSFSIGGASAVTRA